MWRKKYEKYLRFYGKWWIVAEVNEGQDFKDWDIHWFKVKKEALAYYHKTCKQPNRPIRFLWTLTKVDNDILKRVAQKGD